MSDEAVSKFDDPDYFIKRCREFVMDKKIECERMANILTQHPDSPKLEEDANVISEDSLKESVSRLSILFEDDADDAPLLASESSKKKSSRFLRPLGGKRDKSSSPSPTRLKIQTFLAKEYEQLCKMGSKWKKALKESPPKRNAPAPSSSPQSRTNRIITNILMDMERIDFHIGLLNAFILVYEEVIRSPESVSGYKCMKFIDSIKNAIYIDYRHYVEKQIRDNEEVMQFVQSAKSAQGLLFSEPHPKSPSRRLPEQASSKASPPKSFSEADSSDSQDCNATGGASTTGTPKRTKKTRKSRREKKKKVSPNPSKDKGSANYVPVPSSDSDGSNDTVVDRLSECEL